MSVKKFKFVSPGIFINEIDNSQLPRSPEEMGPIVIGRSERGPAMRPVKVNSFSEFVEVFGNPISGGRGDDVWRDGNYLAPTYAAYAAQAWLRNASPLTFVRLLGVDHQDALSTAVSAGWQSQEADGDHVTAYGLFVADAPSEGTQASLEVLINDVVAADAGFAVAIDADGLGGATKTATELSANHSSFRIACTAATLANPGDDSRIRLTSGGVDRDVVVGTAPGADIDPSGMTNEEVAEAIANYINLQHGEQYVASANNGVNVVSNGIAGNAGDAALADGSVCVTLKIADGSDTAFTAVTSDLVRRAEHSVTIDHRHQRTT